MRVLNNGPSFLPSLAGPSSGSLPTRFTFFPWKSFLGLFDLKQGSSVISLFALFNKIAGVYGILAVFSGGTLAQVSLYIYSIVTIVAILWGLRGISDEDPRTVMLYSHLFILDHLVSSFWTFYFAYTTFNAPHNGERPPLAKHQQGLMELIEHLEEEYEIPGKVAHHAPLSGEERIAGAQKVWKEERGFAASVLFAGWLLKIFFALTLYSYALHLRHGTYASLPLAKSSSVNLAVPSFGTRTGRASNRMDEVLMEEMEEEERRIVERTSGEWGDSWANDSTGAGKKQGRTSSDQYASTHPSSSSSGTHTGNNGAPYVQPSSNTPFYAIDAPSAAEGGSNGQGNASSSSSSGGGSGGDGIVREASGTKLSRPSSATGGSGLERRISAGPPQPESPLAAQFVKP